MTLQEAVDQFGKIYHRPVPVDAYNDNGVRKYGRILSDYEVTIDPYAASMIQPMPKCGDDVIFNGETVTVVNWLGPDEPLRLAPNVLKTVE